MFCKYCGNQLKDDAFVCMQCGCETGLHQRALSHAHADKPSVFDAFLYFFFWIFGFCAYFSHRKNRPLYAYSCLVGSAAGAISFAVVFLAMILFCRIWDLVLF